MLKKIKIPIIIFLVGAAAATGYLFVRAHYIADSFDDSSKIAAVWNVSTSTPGEVKLAEKSCDDLNWFCNASTTCANFLGDGSYIIVSQSDAPSTKQWKTANTACDQPQCGINGGQSGDNLKADNTLTFGATYPAREYCKSIGGRLPTIDELECVYNNSGGRGANVFGSFAAGHYWSSTEHSEAYAWLYHFTGAYRLNSSKTYSYYVRCVRGW
jgi:hypothetical protein